MPRNVVSECLILAYRNERAEPFWISTEDIANACQRPQPAVLANLRKLKAMGLVNVRRNDAGKLEWTLAVPWLDFNTSYWKYLARGPRKS